MILKELDTFSGGNAWEKTGRKAEEQLAFYLKRKYHSHENIFVINNLRFPFLDSFVQIDHLIITKYGAVIVESKSVTSKVSYNEKGEWSRLWGNHWQGMPNAVKQAERQGEALKELLKENQNELLEKYVFGRLQKTFTKMQIHLLVAISDQGSIYRKGKDIYEKNVCKAECVTDRIEEIFLSCEKSAGLFSCDEPPWCMNEKELTKVLEFLLQQHVPKTAEKELPEEEIRDNTAEEKYIERPVEKEKTEETEEKEEKIRAYLHCPECGNSIRIVWGSKYKNYYWHCPHCNKNFPISHKCPQCHEKLKIRKQGKEYFIYCDDCQISALYFAEK